MCARLGNTDLSTNISPLPRALTSQEGQGSLCFLEVSLQEEGYERALDTSLPHLGIL